jgi:lipopolysaccharide assembly protein A
VRVVYWALTLAAAAVLICFAVSNRGSASLEFWPLPFILDLPLYLVVFAALLGGFVVGVISGWITGGGTRRQLRHHRRRIDALERELAAAQSQLDDRAQRSQQTLPAAGGRD